MYKVTNTLTSAYGTDPMDFRAKQGPVRDDASTHFGRDKIIADLIFLQKSLKLLLGNPKLHSKPMAP